MDISRYILVIDTSVLAKSKGIYNGREGISSLSPTRHLEKTTNISGTMHYLLLSFLAINRINLILVRNYIVKERHVI
jgi:hypothetical protein